MPSIRCSAPRASGDEPVEICSARVLALNSRGKGLPRLYREAPVNSTWEGSGNVQCLDVLRALSKEPGVLDALFAELGDGHGDARLKRHIDKLQADFADSADIQYRARQLTEDVALALQAKLLLEAGNAAVSDAFIASRLGGGGRVYGTLPRGVDVQALLARSTPLIE